MLWGPNLLRPGTRITDAIAEERRVEEHINSPFRQIKTIIVTLAEIQTGACVVIEIGEKCVHATEGADGISEDQRDE